MRCSGWRAQGIRGCEVVWTTGWTLEVGCSCGNRLLPPLTRSCCLRDFMPQPQSKLSRSGVDRHLKLCRVDMASGRPFDSAAVAAGDLLTHSCCPNFQSGPDRQNASAAQPLAAAISDAASIGPWRKLTCCCRGVQANCELGRACCLVACSIARDGALGAIGLSCSPAPGLRTPCHVFARGPSAAASRRSGLGCRRKPQELCLLIAATCRSHLQEQASSQVSHRRSESCCARWNRQAGGLQVLQQPPAAATCRTKKALCWAHVMHALLLQSLAGASQHSDWLQRKIKKCSSNPALLRQADIPDQTLSA